MRAILQSDLPLATVKMMKEIALIRDNVNNNNNSLVCVHEDTAAMKKDLAEVKMEVKTAERFLERRQSPRRKNTRDESPEKAGNALASPELFI